MEGNFLSLIKGIYKNPTANLILNFERLKAFPLSLEQEKDVSLFLVNIVLGVLVRETRQEKEDCSRMAIIK